MSLSCRGLVIFLVFGTRFDAIFACSRPCPGLVIFWFLAHLLVLFVRAQRGRFHSRGKLLGLQWCRGGLLGCLGVVLSWPLPLLGTNFVAPDAFVVFSG